MITKDLLTASFKGVIFSVRTESQTAGGRRIVLHDYPNSKVRYVEDLGELPPIFKIKAFVHNTDYSNNTDKGDAWDNANRLEAALKASGSGMLSMPTFGSIRVFALPYKKNASQKTVGEIEFDLEFAVGRASSAPSRGKATIEEVFAKGDESRDAAASSLAKVYDVPVGQSNVSTASFDLSEMVKTAFEDFKTVITSETEIEKQVTSIVSNTQTIVRDGVALSNSLITDRGTSGLWQLLSVYSDNGKGLVSSLKQTVFGSQLSLILSDIKRATVDDDPAMSTTQTTTAIPLWPETTAERLQRNRNRLNMSNATRISGLTVAYEQAATSSYSTAEDVQETREALESAFTRLMRVDTDDRDLIQSDNEVRRSMQALRLSALEVLDAKEQQAFVLTTILQNTEISAFELAYELYAETLTNEDDLEKKALEIRGLNPLLPVDKLSGELSVLQS